jgi:hypothetical protein
VSGYGNSRYNAVTGRGDHVGSTGAYTVSIVALEDDNDDQISEATPILIGASVTGSMIDQRSDVDMYAIDIARGDRVGFDLDRHPGSNIDPLIRIFDATGAEIAYNDDAAGPGESYSFESYLVHTFEASGTYFVGVSGFGNRDYDPTTGDDDTLGDVGAYILSTRLISLPQVDDVGDWGNTLATAQSLDVDGTAYDRIRRDWHVDMYRFVTDAGDTLSFDIDPLGGGLYDQGNLNSVLRLFDSRGRELARNDNGMAPGESQTLQSYLEYTFDAGGVYYVGVSGHGNSAYNPMTGLQASRGDTGGYVLHLNRLHSGTDWATLVDAALLDLAIA